jgi:hypothetical protein
VVWYKEFREDNTVISNQEHIMFGNLIQAFHSAGTLETWTGVLICLVPAMLTFGLLVLCLVRGPKLGAHVVKISVGGYYIFRGLQRHYDMLGYRRQTITLSVIPVLNFALYYLLDWNFALASTTIAVIWYFVMFWLPMVVYKDLYEKALLGAIANFELHEHDENAPVFDPFDFSSKSAG